MTDSDRDQLLMSIHANTSVMAEKVDRHEHDIYGNGQIGIMELVRTVSQTQLECPARKSYTVDGKNLKAVWVSIVAAAVIGVSGLVQTAVYSHRDKVSKVELSKSEIKQITESVATLIKSNNTIIYP
jgi:hypothetical protein